MYIQTHFRGPCEHTRTRAIWLQLKARIWRCRLRREQSRKENQTIAITLKEDHGDVTFLIGWQQSDLNFPTGLRELLTEWVG